MGCGSSSSALEEVLANSSAAAVTIAAKVAPSELRKDSYAVKRPAAEKFTNENIPSFIKYVPDCLHPSRLMTKGANATLHFYAIRAIAGDEISHRVLTSCESCIEYTKALNHICIAVPSVLPEDILQVVSELVFREIEVINFHMQYIGCFEVDCETTLKHMQRFHRAVCCWENEHFVGESSSSSSISADEWKRTISSPLGTNGSPLSAKELFQSLDSSYQNIYSFDGETGTVSEDVPIFIRGDDLADNAANLPSYIEAEEWARSSNGAYYIVVPLPDDAPKVVSNRRELFLTPEQLAVLASPELLLQHARRCANDAQALVRNLQTLRRANQERRLHFFPPSEKTVSAAQLRGQLLCRGSLDLFLALDDPGGGGDHVKLDSVMKQIRTKAPVDENGVRGSESAVNVSYKESSLAKHPHWRSALEPLAADPAHCLVSVLTATTKCKLIPLLKSRILPANIRFDSIRLDMQKKMLLNRNTSNGYSQGEDSEYYDQDDLDSLLIDLSPFGLRDDEGCARGCVLPFTKRIFPHSASLGAEKKEAKKSKDFSRYHKHNSPMFLIPECCRPLGRSIWMHMGLCLPSIMWRLQSLLVAVECRDSVAPQLTKPLLPDPALMLEALTPVRIDEGMNSERLENLGDALLKFVSAVVLYNRFPADSEKTLTNKRSDIICNKNLCEVSRRAGIAKFIRCTNLSTGKQTLRIRPPGMLFENIRQMQSLWNLEILEVKCDSFAPTQASAKKAKKKTTAAEEVLEEEEALLALELSAAASGGSTDAAAYFKSLYPLEQHSPALLREKAMADAVEAVVGAFLSAGGTAAGLESIFALGILDRATTGAAPLVVHGGSVAPASKNNSDPGGPDQFEGSNLVNWIDDKIGYRFSNIALLQTALTQSSDAANTATHQRLEFLGDAILDFVVVSILFEHQLWARQGDLHGQKAQATNNDRLAAVAIKLQLYKYVQSSSSELKDAFKKLDDRINGGLIVGDTKGSFRIRDSTNVEYTIDLSRASPGLKVNEASVAITVVDNAHKKESMNVSYVTNQDVKLYDLPDRPRKVLADTLESIIAAVYIDCGSDLGVVADVVAYLDLLPQV